MVLDKIKDEILKKKRIITFVFLLLVIISLSLVTYIRKVRPASQQMGDILANTSVKDKIDFNEEIRQDFTIKDSKIEKIIIPVIYEKEDDESKLDFILKQNERTIQSWTVQFGNKNKNVELELDNPLEIKEEKTYTLIVRNVGDYISQTAYLGKAAWNIPETILYKNGEKLSYDMALRIQGGDCEFLKTIFWGVFLVLLILYSVLYYIIFIKKWEIQKIFVVLAGTIGVLYTVLWSPYACPDEYQHIATAYYYSSDILGSKTVNESGETLLREKDMRITPDEIITRRYTWNKIGKYWNESGCDNGTMVSMRWKPMREVPFTSYLPQILAILLARILGLGNVVWLILGRIFALLFYIITGYLALKYIPFGKRAMFVLMLGPTAIQEAASFSYDSVLNSLSFFIVAYILYMAYEKKRVSIKDWLYILIGTIIITPIKVVYFLLIFLIFLIPNSKISSKKWKAYGLKLGLIVSGIIVFLSSRMETTSAMMGNSMVVNGKEIQGYSPIMLLQKPFHTILLWINTLKERSVYYLKQIFGGYEAYSKVEISWLVIIGFFILLLLAILVEKREKIIDFKGRCFSVIISIGIFAATLLAFNLAKDCTNLTSDCVYGVQGRYFLPFLPLICIAIQNKRVIVEKTLKSMIYIGVYCMQFLTIWRIFETVIGR